jgi:hypothetical protein
MDKKNQGQVNIYNHVNKEEKPDEYGKRYYVDVSSLADAVKATLETENPDYEIELCGVKRWEW